MDETADQTESGFLIARADWETDANTLRSIRKAVFVDEQGIDPALEWDGRDETSAHFLAYDMDGNPVATVRLLDDGHIGRLAVLPGSRGQGIGSALLLAAIELADEHGFDKVYLNAQVDTASFYHLHGFMNEGDMFEEAGIPHICMSRYCGEL